MTISAQQKNYINGQWRTATGLNFQSINPSNNEIVWQGRSTTTPDVNLAIECSREAFLIWSLLSLDQRLAFIFEFENQLKTHQVELAQAIHLDTGKPLWETRTEVSAMIGKISISIDAYHQRTGSTSSTTNGVSTSLHHKPHGVCAVFGPFNFPGHLPNGHIIPALIAGNTVVFKPSEQTPLTADYMLSLWHNTKIPAGVIQLVQGEKDTGIALSQHPQIDGLFFTGSNQTGALLQRHNAQQFGKILALEMGGHNPLIIHDIADIKAAVYIALQSCFITAGQRCTCARKLILVDSPQSKAFLGAFVHASQNLKLTLHNTEGFFGPVINLTQALILMEKQQTLVAAGAQSLLPMIQPDANLAYLTPGILDVTGINVADEEYFGPLVKLYQCASLDDAIAEANNTQYGLAAGLISQDENAWHQVQAQVRAGIVNWNKPTTGASGRAPFGGPGASGNYRPGAFYAADYCAYPVASVAETSPQLPDTLLPGIVL